MKYEKIIYSEVPGQASIPLVAFYEEFVWYYPKCELNTKLWVLANAEPDWCYFDIGANVGIYTILFSRLSPNGFVHAFEPTSSIELCKANCSYNKVQNVKFHKKALGKTSGLITEKIYRIWGNEPEEMKYNFMTVDEFVNENGIQKINLIKIDVDSFDFEVLQGSEKTLAAHNPWLIIELNHALSKRGQSNSEAFLWLRKRGYESAYVIDHENFVLKKDKKYEGLNFSLVYPLI